MHVSRRLKLLGLLVSGAWLPLTVTCQPMDAVIDIVGNGGSLIVAGPSDYYVVDDGPHWFDFGFWHDEYDD
jgi:hypothetical protein